MRGIAIGAIVVTAAAASAAGGFYAGRTTAPTRVATVAATDATTATGATTTATTTLPPSSVSTQPPVVSYLPPPTIEPVQTYTPPPTAPPTTQATTTALACPTGKISFSIQPSVQLAPSSQPTTYTVNASGTLTNGTGHSVLISYLQVEFVGQRTDEFSDPPLTIVRLQLDKVHTVSNGIEVQSGATVDLRGSEQQLEVPSAPTPQTPTVEAAWLDVPRCSLPAASGATDAPLCWVPNEAPQVMRRAVPETDK